MKKIEEQWKTIEEFPDYEISNFGRCRNKKGVTNRNILKKRQVKYKDEYTFNFYDFNIPVKEDEFRRYKRRSVGMLVAKHFIENPDNCKLIEYIDGDTSNTIFTNIKWVKGREQFHYINQKRKYTKEEQLKSIREKIEMMIRFEKALKKGREQEFIYGEVNEMCRQMVYSQNKKRSTIQKEEAISFTINSISDMVSRGYSFASFRQLINVRVKSFFSKNNKQVQTIEIDERRM
jgi:hypothetical protein